MAMRSVDNKLYPAPLGFKGEDPIEAANVLANVRAHIEHYDEQFDTITTIIQLLEPYEGRKLDKRIEEVISPHLPGKRVSYVKDEAVWDRCKLSVWADWNDRMELTVAEGDRVYHEDKFRENVSSYLKGKERADELRALLPRIPGMVLTYNRALKPYRAALAALAPVGSSAFAYRR